MRRLVALGIVVAALNLPGQARAVNGTLRDMGDHDVLHVWGTHEEMGYAHGYLLGDDILALATGYALDLFGLTPEQYEQYRSLILLLLDFPEEMETEAEALVEGMRDAGVELYREELGRELDADDLLLTNAAADLFGVSLSCSSVSAWGVATEGDATLAGELAMTRNLDWTWEGDEADLRDFDVVIAYEPSDPAKQRWVSLAFPGFIGCLSCMNEQGVGSFQNQGNHESSIVGLDLSQPLVPIHFSIREGIETRDLDGDGNDTLHDVVSAVESTGRLGTYDIHLISPADRSDPPAAILECNNGGSTLRLPTDDPLPHPDCLAVTNHHRVLYEPESCSRYDTIGTMVEEYDGELDPESLWEIEGAVTKDWGRGGTIQTMRAFPAELRLDVAFADSNALAPDNPITSYTFAELFEEAGDDDDDDAADDDAADDDGADDDAGDDDDDAVDDDGGLSKGPSSCGCRTGPAATDVSLVLGALVLVARLRTRRAR